MKEIFILGAGGFAREVHFLITQIGGYKILAFVEKNSAGNLDIGKIKVPIISERQLKKFKGVNLALGIGNPGLNEKLFLKFSNDFLFPNLLHPNVNANWGTVTLGMGNIFSSGVNITTDIKIGSGNIFNLAVTIGHDCIIGDFNVINPGANISGSVKVSNNIFIGSNATILQNLTLADGSVVGAGSMVNRNVASGTTVIGIPARILKKTV